MDIVTSWDDACVSDVRLAELLDKYKLKGIFFWQNNLANPFNLRRCKKFLSLNDCKNISKKFEIGSHTINHNYLTDIKIDIAEQEISQSKIFWQNHLGVRIKWFCYPRGRNNRQIVNIVSKYYDKARVTALSDEDKIQDKLLIKPNLHVGVQRKEYADNNWYDFGRIVFNHMKLAGCKTFHLFGHSWELDEFKQWEKLEDFFKFMKDSV